MMNSLVLWQIAFALLFKYVQSACQCAGNSRCNAVCGHQNQCSIDRDCQEVN